MKFEMKENVNVNSYSFKKKVIENTVDLLGRKRNYVVNDIYFMTMIAFVNELVDKNIILESLYEEEKIEEKITTNIEPLFKIEVLDKPDVLLVYNEIVQEIIDYMDREIAARRTIAGFLYDLFNDIGEMRPEQIKGIISTLVNTVQDTGLIDIGSTQKNVMSPQETMNKMEDKIEDMKMRAFIEKFKRTGEQIDNDNKDAE